MATSKMTILGMYNYDNTLFDNLTFPTGIDKGTAVDEILRRSGEFESLYADAGFVKFLIGKWGTKHARTFEKWKAALDIEYDPLYNYDRHEEYQDNENSSTNHDVTTTSGGTSTESVSAYDATEMTPRSGNSSSGSSRDAGSVSGSRGLHHEAHLYGNIGVTTSQQMLRDELEISRWNLYEEIADIFIDEFCVMIY